MQLSSRRVLRQPHESGKSKPIFTGWKPLKFLTALPSNRTASSFKKTSLLNGWLVYPAGRLSGSPAFPNLEFPLQKSNQATVWLEFPAVFSPHGSAYFSAGPGPAIRVRTIFLARRSEVVSSPFTPKTKRFRSPPATALIRPRLQVLNSPPVFSATPVNLDSLLVEFEK